ncbi:hypothetical protein ACNPNN_20650 [Stenotrophomonas geniculata]|uniref:hypothetical protein n=1 Tax=Stenotrophomonas geniculata TaxID=86188 RepID=UPI003AB07AF3
MAIFGGGVYFRTQIGSAAKLTAQWLQSLGVTVAVVYCRSTHDSGFNARNINGTDLVSGRLGAASRMGPLGYKIDADFAGNDVSLKDTYLSWDTRLGSVGAFELAAL